ncbi:hypothetical protein LCM20_16390 [Halobacillus litoralis]|uniref:hypothetical protein n=1 Tax=Halobacillus litoralis TaxID=45668 RepID=UPI001CD3EC0D|nr:hypothetical protein [Halobacillus litoralis]MCA0972188.1 hypothetical protein [Halobacillus litoralis]
MSDYLIEQWTDWIVGSLPEEQQALYTYVIHMEDRLAEVVATEGEFMDRLKIERPHQLAADRFGMTLFELLQTLRDIEEHVSERLEQMLAEVSWVDCTHLVNGGDRKVFYVSLPSAGTGKE